MRLGLLLLFTSASYLPAQTAPSYAKHVKPFLSRYCVECHTGADAEGELRLDTFQALMAGGRNGDVILPGKPDASRLVRMIEGKLRPVMPPKKSKQPTAAEIAFVRAWVLEGARDDSASLRITLPSIVSKVKPATPVAALAYSPDGKTLAAGGRGEVLLLDGMSGEIRSRLSVERDRVTALAYAPKTGTLAVAASAAGEGHEVRLFVGTKGSVTVRHDDVIQALAFSPDGKFLATASYDRLIKLWDVAANKEIRVLRDHSDSVYGIAFSPDGKRLASGGADRAVKVWDVATGNRLYTLGESTDWVYAVAWSPDGKHLAAGGVDRSIRVWQVDAEGGRVVHSVFAHEGPVTQLVYSKDGRRLWSLSEEGGAKSWDTDRMVERFVYPRQPHTPLALAVHQERKEIAIGRFDGTLVVLDEAGKTVRTPLPLPNYERFPTVGEVEPNDSPGAGQRLTLPATVTGALNRAGDFDWYRFEAKAGQEVGVFVRPGATGKLDPLLRLLDASGNLLTESTTGRLGHSFRDAGVYVLGVRDRDYRGGAGMEYRLHVGDIPVVTSIFPMGGRQGSEVAVQVFGANLGATQRVKVKVPADAAIGSRVPVPVTTAGGVPLGSPSLVVGDLPECMADAKDQRILVPGTANGVVVAPGKTETCRFEAKKGQRLILEVHAARIGSQLDSTMEILDGAGNPLPRATLRCTARTFVVFRDHDSRAPGIRIETWSQLAVNDWLLVGSELVRIRALPRNPDDDCQFFQEQGQRLGFLGTTPVFHSQGTPMYKVGIHPPGTTFSPNGLPVVTLYWRNDDGGPALGKDSRLVFDPPADGTYQVRIGDARGEGSREHGYRLTVRPPRPDFSVSLSAPMTVSKGGAVPLRVEVKRLDEFDGVVDLKLVGLPEGFHAPVTNMPAGEISTAFGLFADATAVAPGAGTILELEARARINGKEVVRKATATMPKLMDAGEIVTTTQEREVTIKPGGEVRVTVNIERRNGFAGRVPVEVQGLPHGVRVLDVGLNGILITPTETRRTFVLYCEPWVEAMSHPIVVLAKREGKGTEYAAKSVLLRVTR